MTAIAIIGTGSVGTAVGEGLRGAAHSVVYGVRDPSDSKHAGRTDVMTRGQAADSAEVIVLAVPADGVADSLAALSLRPGQIVVDATNAVRTPVPDGHATMADLVAAHVPAGVHVVKAFNTIGAEHLGDGRFGDQRAFMPIAGDEGATPVVAALAADVGFDVVTLGGRDCFRLVEDHARLWIHLAFRCGWGRQFGFVVAGR